MQTMPAKVKRPMLTSVLGGLALLAMCTTVGAQTTRVSSDEAAGYLVFPKIVADPNGVFSRGGPGVDTVVQITNTSGDLIRVNCWYVNATGECDNEPGRFCRENSDCSLGGTCETDCAANDFQLTLTPRQPLAWRVSDPYDFLPCQPNQPSPPPCADPNSWPWQNDEAGIPPLSSVPFQGELKCVQVNDDDEPVERNDLKGEATIYAVGAGLAGVDVAAYNAIGVQVVSGANNGDNELVMGQEYASCPLVLVVDHLFDFAPSPINPSPFSSVTTELTLVPCTENLLADAEDPVTIPAQMLIYNEFEQRFSTSRRISCYANMLLSDLDTRLGPKDNYTSIFSVGTQGTIAGQTRIRGVQTGSVGGGFLGVAQQIHRSARGAAGSAAVNLGYSGERQQSDVVTLSVPLPALP